jgi:pentatricopeptide repeat protein
MLTWDLLERLGYEAQESTYECMIQAFCASYRKDQLAFACLAEMINCGYVPSRSLIRSMSRSIRFSVRRIENAYRMIIHREMGCEPSLYSLNTIISAFAENGEMDRAFDILFQDFVTFDIEPDGDTYSYAMESLATSSMIKTNPNDTVEIENAEYLLKSMAKQGLKLNCYVFHEYIRILVNHGKLGLARSTYLEAIALEDLDIDCKTPALLAKIYAENEGDFEAAREIVNSTKVPIPFLHHRINRWERERKIHRKTNKPDSGND